MEIKKVKENYEFAKWDENVLLRLAPLMEDSADEFIEAFYGKIMKFKNASTYLKNEQIISKHRGALIAWFLKLFRGPFDDEYLYYLEGVGYTHVKVGLPSHYVNVSISFVQNFCLDIIARKVRNGEERSDMITALGKIMDINLDVLTSSYIKEEKNIFFFSKKAENKLISFATRFSHWLNIILVVGLVILGLMVLGLTAYDLTHIFNGNIEKGLLATLGSLLMLWVVIELVDTEVDTLRGGRFSIKVFISVAMVAVIRKILVTSLKSGAGTADAQYTLIAALAVLGVLYWLITKTEIMQLGAEGHKA
ncbi:MAG: protoglobin domain-containing protein [bacterium]|nr:protoglobin domain-containing protein [bacterium]